jgi:hypothetical protein
MRKKLTPKVIDSLPPAIGKRYEVRDELLTGLLVRVSSTGGKVWYTSCRIEYKIRRIKIGTYPILSLADAREKARALLRDVQLGKYNERQEPTLPTFGEIIPQFIELYAKPRNRSWKSTERVLTKFSTLNDRPVNEIRRGHVVSILDGLTASGATSDTQLFASNARVQFHLGADCFQADLRLRGCLRFGGGLTET